MNSQKEFLMLRICSKCQKEKNIDDFTKDKRKSCGRSMECYECHRNRNKEYSKRMPEEVKKRKLQKRSEYGQRNKEAINKRLRENNRADHKKKEYMKKYRDAHKDKIRAYMNGWREKNWEKVLAHSAVKDHVDRGNIIKPSKCPICNSSDHRIEAHHSDYSKPLEIVWMCQICHLAIHQRINEEKRLSDHRERLIETDSERNV